MTTPSLTLNDGFAIPALGFGTYPLVGADGASTVRSALDTGYRLLDSAVNYENEGIVGLAARRWLLEAGVPREELTVQSKLPGRHHDFDRAIASGYESAARMGLERIDVLLIHWPNPITGRYREAWRALVELRDQGVVRSIGVSNFTPRLLEEIVEDSGVVPAINQVELHPHFPQTELLEVHARMGIVTQAWSPLGKRQAPYAEPVVVEAASRLGVTPAQVILRWHLERGTVPLPKSATPSRQAENLAVDRFSLLPAEVAAITALGREDGRLFDGDPERHEEM